MRTSYSRAGGLICLTAGFLLADWSTTAEQPPPADEVTVCTGEARTRDIFDDATIASIRDKIGIRLNIVFDSMKALSGEFVDALSDGRCTALVVQGAYADWAKTVEPEGAKQITHSVIGRSRTRAITLVNRGRPSQALLKVIDLLRESDRQ